MSRLLYYLVILPVSYLPFWFLYLLSDIVFFMVYYLVGYRRKVVSEGLRKSFPEKSDAERLAIEKGFYAHISDLLVESLKTFSISAEQSLVRMKVRNAELLDRFFEEGRSVTCVGGHNGNWELYAVACDMQIKHQTVGLYTRMQDPFFNEMIAKSRSRFGLMLVPTSDKKGIPVPCEIPTATIFGIDQCPRADQRAHWMEFLNQDTGVRFGAEKFARTHNMPVIFGNIRKLKRGHYEVTYELVCENPNELPLGGIMEKSTQMLEEKIKLQPECWLWSHKRWKRSRPVDGNEG